MAHMPVFVALPSSPYLPVSMAAFSPAMGPPVAGRPHHNPIPDMGAEWLTVCQEPPLSNITIHCTLVSIQTTTVPHNKYILNNNMLVKIWQCINITDINLIKHYGYVTHGFLFKAITYWGRGKWLPYWRQYFYAIHEWEFCYCVIEYQWKSFPKVQLSIYHQCFR